jgi:NAD(P)-dependent dehydrogenase (short-subunit alcohol dehydrogenase family)
VNERKKVWLVTGCSSGLGRAIALAVVSAGHKIAVTARNPATLAEFQKFDQSSLLILDLDVTDNTSIKNAVEKTLDKLGPIDVLVNNAGYAYYSVFEELEMDQFKAEMDVNLYGLVKTCQAVLPQMRKQRHGHIINISSIAASVGTEGRSAYSASKFAVSGISECLAAEVSSFGIRVTVLEPGAFRTNILNNPKTIVHTAIWDYAKSVETLNKDFAARNGHQDGDPAMAAQAIVALSELKHPPLRIPLGSDAVQMLQNRLMLMVCEMQDWKSLGINTRSTTH